MNNSNHNFCPICDGLIYLDSTESDHRIAKAVGGQGVLENGLLVHPICNRMKLERICLVNYCINQQSDELIFADVSMINHMI